MIGVLTFAATNVDDIFLLVLFFSQVDPTFRRWHVVIGQYLGFMTLIRASLIGFLASLILPRTWISLMGVIPILMGIGKLVHRKKNIQQVKLKHSESQQWRSSVCAGLLHHQAYNVAAIKFANGSDNISIYTLLFAGSNLARLGVCACRSLLLPYQPPSSTVPRSSDFNPVQLYTSSLR